MRPNLSDLLSEPCHPTGRSRPPSGSAWVHEIKADGYRAQVHLRKGRAIVYSRGGHDWTKQFGSIARAAETLPAQYAVLDGEAIVQDQQGVADFNALRRELAKPRGELTYYAFDLLYLDGQDLMAEMAKEHGMSIQELFGKGRKGKGSVAAKYRDPKNPENTWTGRGRMPRWLVAATKGKKANREDFLIK